MIDCPSQNSSGEEMAVVTDNPKTDCSVMIMPG